MREFEVSFQKGLGVGLRPDKGMSRDKETLSIAKNFMIGSSGVEPKPTLTQPFPVTFNWPFPIWKKLNRTWLLCYKGNVYITNSDGSSKKQILSNLSSLTWHFADFHKYIVICNDNGAFAVDPDSETASSAGLPQFRTCCNFKGQIFAGNITGFKDCDETYVAWSDIGEANFEPGRKNEAGWAPAGVGEVYKVLPLSGAVMVYGADGVATFTPQGRPAPTFGKMTVSLFGLASRDAVDGNGRQHVFLDDSGVLWAINSQMEVQRLGYKEFFEPMIGGDIVVSHNPHLGEFYISDGSITYLLYKGLTQVCEAPTSINYHNGENLAVYQDVGDKNFELATGPLDFGYRGTKRVEALELGVDTNASLQAAVDFRSSYDGDWKSSDWRRVNREGVAIIGVMSNELRLKLKTTNAADVNLDRIKTRLKLDDKRFVRGTCNAN